MCLCIVYVTQCWPSSDLLLYTSGSLDFSEQISDLLLRALSKSFLRVSVLDNGNFEVSLSHFSLKSVLQGLDGGVNSIADVNIVCVGLLEEGTSFSSSLAKSSSLPAVEGA